MAFVHVTRSFLILSCICIVAARIRGANGQLTDDFYATTCPNLRAIVLNAMQEAIADLPRNAAFILRMHFHDCFVNGCDGSILLDDTGSFTGEKGAAPNVNSIQGYEVIDTIKAKVEAACNGTVSCADILALAAQSGVNILGGPAYKVPLGRRDATTASQSAANNGLPGPGSSLASLIQVFGSHGLSAQDMTALSGAHTIGFARCSLFRTHIYNETNIDPAFAATRQATCPFVGGDSNLAPLDLRTSGLPFDVGYYQDLVNRSGLFHSDQELFNGGSQDSLVLSYSTNQALFFADFAAAMIRMGNISPLTGTAGEIRRNCRVVN